MYDIDLFDAPVSTIQKLQSRGVKVTCYFSAGSYEGWRPDWKVYFPFITGSQYTGNKPPFAGQMSGWNERWLDIRRLDLLTPIMTARLKLAASKGCDAVEPDNVDAYANGGETGVSITYNDQLTYNRWLANTAHSLGLAVALKNDIDQLPDLVTYFDFAINEQCYEYQECGKYKTFTNANKAVFGAEYTGNPAVFCPIDNANHLSFMKKKLALDAWRIGCETFP
jgi:hypothetical protein